VYRDYGDGGTLLTLAQPPDIHKPVVASVENLPPNKNPSILLHPTATPSSPPGLNRIHL